MAATVILATGNPGKLQEFQEFLAGWNVLPKPPELDIEETGQTFAENARLKALGIAQATGQLALADDSGLEVLALGGRPGLYSARWGRTDRDRMARVLALLQNEEDRRAQFVCYMAFASPKGIIAESMGICAGEILRDHRGSAGFGYDPIFYYPPLGLTLAEMNGDQKHQISHRAIALNKLLPFLERFTQEAPSVYP